MGEGRSTLALQRIETTRCVARDLFMNHHIKTYTTVDNKLQQILPLPDQFTQIIDIIGDSGLMFISTWEELAEQWLRLRNEESDYGTGEHLLQMATTFRALAFGDEIEYQHWINHLAEAYGAQSPSGRLRAEFSNGVKNVIAVDDELIERLPTVTTHQDLLTANPWFTYLVTLQLSYHEIWSKLIDANREQVMRNVFRSDS